MARIWNKYKQSNTHLKRKVFVAMSGGVDSSVAAALLQRDGYDVYGVFMQGWSNPHFNCEWERDRRDAARVTAVLGIPFRVLDFSREYYERVVSYLVEEYKAGRTPNPDVMCNKEIKFGLFFDWAIAEGADYVATGHYASIENQFSISNFQFPKLKIAKDLNKDQTYFLWTLTKRHLERTLFPIGDYKKPEVREIARSFGLPTASKKDSQGICFVGDGSIADFLRDRIATTRGIVKTASGKIVGEHDGVELFTIGQRHGIGVRGGAGPYYVAEKNSSTGTLLVAENEHDPALYKKEIPYRDANWLVFDVKHQMFDMPFECEARIRYRQPLAKCTVYEDRVIFDVPQRAVAPGQSIVFYSDGALVGGGIIEQEQ